MRSRSRSRKGWRRVFNGVNPPRPRFLLFASRSLGDASSFKTPANVGPGRRSTFRARSASTATPWRSQYTFGRYILNSVIVAVAATVLVLVLGTFASMRWYFPCAGKFTLLVMLLAISSSPEIAVVSPLYLLLRNLGWLNGYQALILPYGFFLRCHLILRNYFLAIPRARGKRAP
jgi:multiple sugar transport system permease protein